MPHQRIESLPKKPSAKLYENKVEEQHTLSLVATLVFGFSITLLIESDEQIFDPHPELAYIFGISLMIVIVSSALATLILMGTTFLFRRYMFRQSISALQIIKNETLRLRQYARKMLYMSFIGLFVNLGAYGHAKWDNTNDTWLFIISYVILFFGMMSMAWIYLRLNKINSLAVQKMQASSSRNIMV